MELILSKKFSALLPPLTAKEYDELEKSIFEDGLREKIIVWDDQDGNVMIVVDGYNRIKICKKYGIEWENQLRVKKFEDEDAATMWVYRNQSGRRNLTDDQRAAIAAEMTVLFEKAAKKRQNNGTLASNEAKGKSSEKAAEIQQVSISSVERSKRLKKKSPKAFKQVKSGEKSYREAKREIFKPDLQKPQSKSSGKKVMTARDCYKVQYGMVDLNGNFTRGSISKYFTPPEDSQEGIDLEWLNGKFDGVAEEASERYAVKGK